MSISRRQFNTLMMAAAAHALTRRVTAQSSAFPAAPSALPTVPGPVAAGPLAALERGRLHAIDDLRLNSAGADAAGNLDKITDAMVKLCQKVRSRGVVGGEIYFPTGTYAISRPLRTLPDIAFIGESAEGSILKNTFAGNAGDNYWNGAVLFAGHDHPMEGWVGKFRYRPFSVTSQKDDQHVMVTASDYDQVRIGDEIKILGANNVVEIKKDLPFNVRRPDQLVKVIVTAKKTSGGDRILEIDRPLPWTLLSEGNAPWGDLRGMPAWMLVKDWFGEHPDCWMRQGLHGHDAYTSAFGPEWGRGWTSRRNLFKNLTLWSPKTSVMFRGMHCDSVFDHCILKAGYKCIFGNSFQYSRLDNCTCYFADQAAEIAFASLYCQLTNLVAIHDPSLGPPKTKTMGLFTLSEQSQGFIVDNLILKASTREMFSNSKAIVVCASNCHFRRLRMELPSVPDLFRIHPHDPGLASPTNVTFRDMNINMPGQSYNSFALIEDGSNHVSFEGVEVGAASGRTFTNLRDANCHDLTFADVAAPGELAMTADCQNVRLERCALGGGITGPHASSVKVVPGNPDFSRWS